MFLTKIPADERLLNINQACEVGGVSRRTIYNWIRSGRIDYMRTASGSIRIVEKTLFRQKDEPAVQIDNLNG